MPNNDTTKQEENNKTQLTKSPSTVKEEMNKQFLETREQAIKVKENSLQVIEGSDASFSQKEQEKKEALSLYNVKIEEAERNLLDSINKYNGGYEAFDVVDSPEGFRQDSSDIVQDDFNSFESYED